MNIVSVSGLTVEIERLQTNNCVAKRYLADHVFGYQPALVDRIQVDLAGDISLQKVRVGNISE